LLALVAINDDISQVLGMFDNIVSNKLSIPLVKRMMEIPTGGIHIVAYSTRTIVFILDTLNIEGVSSAAPEINTVGKTSKMNSLVT
jgi:hypothetical protein